jgi:hypothetical protein
VQVEASPKAALIALLGQNGLTKVGYKRNMFAEFINLVLTQIIN